MISKLPILGIGWDQIKFDTSMDPGTQLVPKVIAHGVLRARKSGFGTSIQSMTGVNYRGQRWCLWRLEALWRSPGVGNGKWCRGYSKKSHPVLAFHPLPVVEHRALGHGMWGGCV